jgi:hypothetical protein
LLLLCKQHPLLFCLHWIHAHARARARAFSFVLSFAFSIRHAFTTVVSWDPAPATLERHGSTNPEKQQPDEHIK